MQNGETSPIPLNTERVIRHLALCGLMGVGKTAVGEITASRLGRTLRDNDATLHRMTGATAAEIEQRYGVDRLHRLEATALAHDVRHPTPSVITAAASTITDPEIQRLLRRYTYVVWLDAPPEVSAARMLSGQHRPLRGQDTSDPVGWVTATRAAREPAFRAVADLVVDTSTAPPDELAEHIVAQFKLASSHTE
jgi:shikimate kinase